MRLFASVLCTAIAVGILAACSGNTASPNTSAPSSSAAETHFQNGRVIPAWSKNASLIPIELRPARSERILNQLRSPEKALKSKGGIYISEFAGTNILGFPNPNERNRPPICVVSGVSYPNDIAVDGKGNLIDPDGGTNSVIVFKGPGMCGSSLGSISDPYGMPSDAASSNAATGAIIVGNIFSASGGAGSISLCTISGGCTTNLTNANMYEVAGVAQAKNGDCWASAITSAGTATLTYFKACSGPGQATTGYQNVYYGGLDVDSMGNLVAISAFTPSVYVYKGCNPKCMLVGGPFPLHGEAVFGHLDKKSQNFVTGDYEDGEADVYKYSPTKITYAYRFTNGLSTSYDVEGAAFNPRSKQ